MKKTFMTFLLVFLFLPLTAFAQAPDTVTIPWLPPEPNRLPTFILGDTTATGARVNPNRVYRLERGGFYLLSGAYNYRFKITLIGDGDETLAPPVILPATLQDGSIPDILMQFTDGHIRNIRFSGWTLPSADGPKMRSTQSYRILRVMTPDPGLPNRLVVEKCIFEGFRQGAISVQPALYTTVILKDNVFRNFARDRIEFASSVLFFGTDTPIDTIIMTNNTYFNGNNYFLCSNTNTNNYVRVEHNTVFVNNVNPFFAYHLNNAYIKNNLFVATASWGEKLSERSAGNYNTQGNRISILSLDNLPSNYGVTDAARRVELTNNAYWWPEKLTNIWNDSIFGPAWICDRTDSIFKATTYPNMIEANNLNVDPGFTDNSVLDLLDKLADHIYMCRIDPGRSVGELYLYKWDENEFPEAWPLPENLAYTNSTLLTGSDKGLPIGDLNWFPDKRKEWGEKYEVISVDQEPIATIPVAFKLEQNYPNPFNPSTVISFQVPEKTNVSLKVHDILGREVSTLVNQVMEAGEHKVNFNASKLTTGVYFYTLKCDNFVSVKKMMLLK